MAVPGERQYSYNVTSTQLLIADPYHLCLLIVHRGDKSDHSNIPAILPPFLSSEQLSNLLIAIPNYRLSHSPAHPEREVNVHPIHILDTVRSVIWLADQGNMEGILDEDLEGSKGKAMEIGEIYLVGHSCGAHIISHILVGLPHIPIRNDPSSNDASSSSPTLNETNSISSPERTALSAMLRKVRGYGFLDGIYDLGDLIDEYASYEFFVVKAFGDKENWSKGSVSSLDRGELKTQLDGLAENNDGEAAHIEGKKMLVAHSKEDELLTERQSRLWEKWLRDVAKISPQEEGKDGLWYDNETLQGTHDGCLQHEGLGKLLGSLLA